MAVNIARMRYHEWVHGYLTPHNITLDSRIVDLDSVETIEEHQRQQNPSKIKSFKDDITEAATSLHLSLYLINKEFKGLSRFLSTVRDDKSFQDYFKKIYNEELERLKAEKRAKRKSKNK